MAERTNIEWAGLPQPFPTFELPNIARAPRLEMLKIVAVHRIVRDCTTVNVPVFVKQMGSNSYVQPPNGPLLHPKGGDPSEWPASLRVRQFPEERR